MCCACACAGYVSAAIGGPAPFGRSEQRLRQPGGDGAHSATTGTHCGITTGAIQHAALAARALQVTLDVIKANTAIPEMGVEGPCVLCAVFECGCPFAVIAMQFHTRAALESAGGGRNRVKAGSQPGVYTRDESIGVDASPVPPTPASILNKHAPASVCWSGDALTVRAARGCPRVRPNLWRWYVRVAFACWPPSLPACSPVRHST